MQLLPYGTIPLENILRMTNENDDYLSEDL